jgi:hypothetical protein
MAKKQQARSSSLSLVFLSPLAARRRGLRLFIITHKREEGRGEEEDGRSHIVTVDQGRKIEYYFGKCYQE